MSPDMVLLWIAVYVAGAAAAYLTGYGIWLFLPRQRERRALERMAAAPHRHQWEPWRVMSEVAVYASGGEHKLPIGMKLRQQRRCRDCGYTEIKATKTA